MNNGVQLQRSITRIVTTVCVIVAIELCGLPSFMIGSIPSVRSLHGQQAAPKQTPKIPNLRQEKPESISRAAIIEFKGPIDYQLTQFFRTRFAQAESEGVDLLIIEIDSPGGLLAESLEIAEKLRDCDWAYTVAFIPKEAISGAALVALGCDEIVIDTKAIYGDIGAIYQESDGAFRYIPAKMNSYLVRDASNIAESKGRPRELAAALIDKDITVYWKPKLEGHEYKMVRVGEEKPGAPWQLIEESGPELFLTVSGARAIEIGIAQTVGETRGDLAKLFDYDENEIRVYKPTIRDSIVYYLNTSLITGLLVVIGLVALYIELSAPGIGAGGLIAGLCALLFFWSRFLGGTSTWLEVLLFIAGIVFLVVEIFVIPGWGVSGLMGLILIFTSVVMASQDFVLPSSSRQWSQFLTTLLIILCSGCVFLISAFFITRKFGALPMFNRMVLNPQIDTGAIAITGEFKDKPVPHRHPDVSIGDWGTSESLLRPAGRARFNGRSFDVVSDGSFIQPQCQVKVIEIQGNRIVVSEVEDDPRMAETTYPPTKTEETDSPSEKS